MAFWDWFLGRMPPPGRAQPRADMGGGVLISTPAELEAAMRGDIGAGGPVTPESALRVAAVYACVRLISGAVANLPLHIKRRVDERTRIEAGDEPAAQVLRRKPNGWQTPATFRRMMQAHLLLRGNAYALIVRSRGRVIALVPMHPDRVQVRQLDDMSVVYEYTAANGRQVVLPKSEVFHLLGLTLDGVRGLSVIAFARESIGLSQAMEQHGVNIFRNGARVSSVLRHPAKLTAEAVAILKAGLESFRAGGEQEGKSLILEEGMEYEPIAMNSEDAQWIESRKLSQRDIAMFFGVPPHMIGDTEKTTSWGSGIEQQSIGFISFTLEDHLTMWEQTVDLSLLDANPDLYARFNRAALVRGDIKARWEAYVRGMQWGVWSPNEVRGLEDANPREGGDIYYPPPNMTRDDNPEKEDGNEPTQTA